MQDSSGLSFITQTRQRMYVVMITALIMKKINKSLIISYQTILLDFTKHLFLETILRCPVCFEANLRNSKFIEGAFEEIKSIYLFVPILYLERTKNTKANYVKYLEGK